MRDLTYNPETGEFSRKPMKSNKYLAFHFQGQTRLAHRVAWFLMTGAWPVGQIDHIDGNPHNNKWDNLRDVTPSGNQQNKRRGVLGNLLGTRKKRNSYQAMISVGGYQYTIGTFKTQQEAHEAYLVCKRVVHPTCTI
jgi:hypothetical protein